MRIVHNLRLDLCRCGVTPQVDAVQGEGNTRVLSAALYDKGVAWEIPEGTTAALAFRKPDGTKGLYDTLPNGDPAATITYNTISVTLAPQVLTVAGKVDASIVLYDKDLDTLATFPFRITVEVNPAAGEQISNDYYKYSTLEQLNKAILDLQQGGTGNVSDEQIAQAVEDYFAEHPGSGGNVNLTGSAAPGQMIIVKTVDENGTPTEWKAIDRTHWDNSEILPKTYLEEGTLGGTWAPMVGGFIFKLPNPLIPGKTYTVAVNDVTYTATAILVDDEFGDPSYKPVRLSVPGALDIYYYPSYHEGEGFSAGECTVWYEGCEDYENMYDDGLPGWIPATISIHGEGIRKLDIKYLDMDAIKAALPAIDLTATLEDGTTRTYKLYGEVME